jgi:hypothetical protein
MGVERHRPLLVSGAQRAIDAVLSPRSRPFAPHRTGHAIGGLAVRRFAREAAIRSMRWILALALAAGGSAAYGCGGATGFGDFTDAASEASSAGGVDAENGVRPGGREYGAGAPARH